MATSYNNNNKQQHPQLYKLNKISDYFARKVCENNGQKRWAPKAKAKAKANASDAKPKSKQSTTKQNQTNAIDGTT